MTIEKRILKLVEKKSPANPLLYVKDLIKPMMLKRLNESIINCNSCKDNSEKNTNFGNPKAQILVIVDNLGDLEKDFLLQALEELDVNINHLYFVSTVGCRVKAVPTKHKLEECKTYLDAYIKTIDPTMIILLGNSAVKVFSSNNIVNIKGDMIEIYGIETFATYGPNYILREEEARKYFEEDFKEDLKKIFNHFRDKYNVNIYKGE